MEEEGSMFVSSHASLSQGYSYFVIEKFYGEKVDAINYARHIWEAVKKRELLYSDKEIYLRVMLNSDTELETNDVKMFLAGEHNGVLGSGSLFSAAVTPVSIRSPHEIYFRLLDEFVLLCETLQFEDIEERLFGEGIVIETDNLWADFIAPEKESLDLSGLRSQFPVMMKNYPSENFHEFLNGISLGED